MDYTLVRTRRKTIAICVARDGAVTVRAPLHAPLHVIERFIREKQGWIEEKSGQMARREAERKAFRLAEGSELPFLGRNYPIAAGDTAAFDGKRFVLPKGEYDAVRPQLIRLYQTLAEQVILPRVKFFSDRTGWVPAGARIGSAATAWGSCSGKNRLNFTWKLVAAEPDVIDYVVVHELAHLVEHNHSRNFWNLVAGVLPDFRIRRAKLKTLEENLQKIGLG